MIAAGWRRLGVSSTAFAILGLAVIALLLSRGAGSGWLVVVAAVFLGSVVFAAAAAALGTIGMRVDLQAPTDAVVGDTITIAVTVASLVPQLRTVTFLGLDQSTHVVEARGESRLTVRTERRGMTSVLELDVRGGLPLGIIRPARRFVFPLRTPLAVAPVPSIVSLAESLGEDPAAEVRTVRAYTAGDPARLVHWRSTARRGELMVRELESAELLRGSRLQIRVTLDADTDRADAVASSAAGLAITALDAGVGVELLTCEEAGPRAGEVKTRREVGRRLAAAVTGAPPTATSRARLVELGP